MDSVQLASLGMVSLMSGGFIPRPTANNLQPDRVRYVHARIKMEHVHSARPQGVHCGVKEVFTMTHGSACSMLEPINQVGEAVGPGGATDRRSTITGTWIGPDCLTYPNRSVVMVSPIYRISVSPLVHRGLISLTVGLCRMEEGEGAKP